MAPRPVRGTRMPPTRFRSRPLIALVVAVVAALSACGGGGGGDAGTVVTFWQFFPEETLRPLVARYEAEHPGVRIDMQQLTWGNGLEKITAAVAAGRPPDLCELGSTWFAKFAANGALADLTDETSDLVDDYLMWAPCTYGGRTYALPWLTGTRALFYNRTLFARGGLDPAAPPDTWSELLDAARATHDPKAGVYGYGMNAGERYVQFKKFMPFAWGNGGDVLNPEGTECVFDSREVLTALRFVLDLKEYSLLEKQEILDQAFKEGRLAMMISGGWMLKTIARDVPDLDYGVALIPRPDGVPDGHASFGGGEVLVTFTRSKAKEEAVAFARWLIEAPQAMAVARVEQSVLPAAVAAASDSFFTGNPRQRVFLKQLETAVFPPNTEAWVEIEDVVDRCIEEAIHGSLAPEIALEKACDDIDAILAREPR